MDTIENNFHKHLHTWIRSKELGFSPNIIEYMGTQVSFHGALMSNQPKILLIKIAHHMRKVLTDELNEASPQEKEKIQILIQQTTHNNTHYIQNYGS
jgi:hypothetical protein